MIKTDTEKYENILFIPGNPSNAAYAYVHAPVNFSVTKSDKIKEKVISDLLTDITDP